MKAELRNETTLVITPESTAEMIVLRRFGGGTAAVERPEPFAPNVEALLVTPVSASKAT